MTTTFFRQSQFLGIIAISWMLTVTGQSTAATLPTGFTETVFAPGLANPTAMAFASDGRLFVAQQGGQLRVIKNGVLLPTPFLSLNVSATGERGLLGIAFDPDFAVNRFVYVYYTATTPNVHNRVSRFTANGDVAVTGSERVILDLDPVGATNHNGGALHFAADDTLYIAVGDNADSASAQTLTSRFGKILRINPDGTIPTNNPFFNSASGVNRAIWALGLRNPFTFAIHPETGQILINDVGERAWEEINLGVAGANYGWPATEGYTTNPTYKSPFYAYSHTNGVCAITGGTFYNPAVLQFPSTYVGWYFFADYCGGWIKRINPGSNTSVIDFATNINSPVDIKVGPDGALYYLARGDNSVFRIRSTSTQSQAPTITNQPVSRQVAVGQAVTFGVTVNGTAPLSYQWTRNGANISGATAASYRLNTAALADNGVVFRCVVRNSVGSVTSNGATLTVTATTNRPPVGTITTPTPGTLYTAGQMIRYQGTGSDPETGVLPASAFKWRVDFHHDTHVHPFLPEKSGVTSGSFTIPTTGETSANVWYRIYLTVTDAAGLTHSSFRDVVPRKVTLTLASNLPGAMLSLDGQPQVVPFSVVAVVGMTRTLGAWPQQTIGNVNRVFHRWSDGGAATHPITVPTINTTYMATYIQGTQNQAPAITSQPGSLRVTVGQAATFRVTASGAAPLSYQWTRNNVNIAGATAASYRLNAAALADNGVVFRCVVRNSVGSVTSNGATLTVSVNTYRPPVGTITSPTQGLVHK